MAARAAARGMASRARAGPPALSPAAYAASLEVEHYASMPLLDLNLTNLQRSIDDGRMSDVPEARLAAATIKLSVARSAQAARNAVELFIWKGAR